MKTVYTVIQEGGTSSEVYLSVFDTLDDAREFKADCWEDGAYRTSSVGEVEVDDEGRMGFDEVESLIQCAAQRDFEAGNES